MYLCMYQSKVQHFNLRIFEMRLDYLRAILILESIMITGRSMIKTQETRKQIQGTRAREYITKVRMTV
ncbi:hypothetical protein LINPERHAP1_LOCUS19728 [Linum perenne]